MDKLEELLKMQKALDDYIKESRQLEFTKEEWVQKRTLAMLNEVSELLNEINYKWWKNKKEINLDAVKEELVDVFHFFAGMCNDVGLSADELYKIYLSKNEENYNRQKGLSSKKGYELDKN